MPRHRSLLLGLRRPSWALLCLLPLLGLLACDDNDQRVNCNDPRFVCDFARPSFADFRIRLTIDGENPRVPIAIYAGRLEDERLIGRDTLGIPEVIYQLPTDEYFTVTATYRHRGRTIIAVDGDRTRVSNTDECGYACWRTTRGTADLRLANYY